MHQSIECILMCGEEVVERIPLCLGAGELLLERNDFLVQLVAGDAPDAALHRDGGYSAEAGDQKKYPYGLLAFHIV